jgi:DNA-directed RNA polymerase subunit H (RpoH/RPB5)
MTSHKKILQIYNARKNILDILEIYQEYDVSKYSNFSINEIDAMIKNNQLDMLVNHTTEDKKTYIKFVINSKQMRPQNLDDIIEDLFLSENILTLKDNLIIVTEEEPNETILTKMRYLYDHDGIYVVIHNIKRLQFNILKHSLVPAMGILTEKKTEELMKTKFLKDLTQLPEIGRFDPQVLALCVRPGQVCKIVRDSVTAMKTVYYRLCV